MKKSFRAFGLDSATVILATCAAGLSFASTANAADFGGDCCADLEERIAELEATTARKGNRKVNLTISGHVHQAVMFWDDGVEDNVYVVDNQNDQSNFAFTGDAKINPDWTAGFNLIVRLQQALSGEVSADDDAALDDGPLIIREANWFLESKTFGKLSVGFAPRVTDGAPENDLSEAGLPAYAGMQDIGGGFSLRRSSDGSALDISWGDLMSHLNGDTANLVRYDTPELAGFVFSVSAGEDDIWDVGGTFSGKLGQIAIEAAVAYSQLTDNADDEPDSNVIVGSVAFLHEPTGLNFLVAAGQQSFETAVLDTDGVTREAEDFKFIYMKAGWITQLNTLGNTAFYGEYGHFEDLATARTDSALVEGLTGGANNRVAGSEVEAFGFGVNQNIEAADMDIYIGYRYYDAEFSVVDGAGAAVATADTEDFQSVIVGSDIRF
ncbi:MAG: hypothetical protein AAFV69_01035 [Pseudomonadota bacterium]